MKLYVLAEPSGMVQRTIVYGGSADTEVGGSKHTEKVVLKLIETKTGAGHSLYMDNYYNSVSLSDQLLRAKTYSTGTLRANRAGNPHSVLTKKLKKVKAIASIHLKAYAFANGRIDGRYWPFQASLAGNL
ncbi:unnamed protein product [Acanthoscelides obtectus]|uniref:PiggyBac transposable element-derived protein domain-containing protein n=1 Tax=Acanthoscelides obtectus TaxID=200917 RepID=A0A9P0KND3_ACAOB|nr:unnamed protein product [Acanthoscelides obtectus]CAK1682122.1 hypothetical protein AOBTE_LOCUS33442 [Acanthoscelides obtectus]